MTDAEIKILECLYDKFNLKYIARDDNGDLCAYKNMPEQNATDKIWDDTDDYMYLCDIVYETLDLDHDLDINIKDVTFNNLSSTSTVYDIETLLEASKKQ